MHRSIPTKTRIRSWLLSFSLISCLGFISPAHSQPSDVDPRTLIPEIEPVSPPDRAENRFELSNDIVAYIFPDDDLPMFTLTVAFRGGQRLVPEGKQGAGILLGELWQRSGAGGIDAKTLSQRFDELAVVRRSFISQEAGGLTMNGLMSEFNEALPLFETLLFNPDFDNTTLVDFKGQVAQQVAQQNQSPNGLSGVYLNRLIYGPEDPVSRGLSFNSVSSVITDDLETMHARLLSSRKKVIVIRGRFDQQEMKSRLESLAARWPQSSRTSVMEGKRTDAIPAPGIYHTPLNNNSAAQAVGILVFRTVQQGDPATTCHDFLSGLMSRQNRGRLNRFLRSEANLNVTASPFVQPGIDAPGTFGVFFQAQAFEIIPAAHAVLDALESIQTEPPTPAEMNQVREQVLRSYNQTFSTMDQRLSGLIEAELTNLPEDSWEVFRQQIATMTAEEVAQWSAEQLDPKNAVLLVIGSWPAVTANQTTLLANLEQRMGRAAVAIPPLDPMSLEPKP